MKICIKSAQLWCLGSKTELRKQHTRMNGMGQKARTHLCPKIWTNTWSWQFTKGDSEGIPPPLRRIPYSLLNIKHTQAHTHTKSGKKKTAFPTSLESYEMSASGGLEVFLFLLPQELLGMFEVCTPQKSNIDTKNDYILKESTCSKPSFWVLYPS